MAVATVREYAGLICALPQRENQSWIWLFLEPTVPPAGRS